MKYKSRSLRERSGGRWQARLTHQDPLTGESVVTYHTIIAKTRKQAERARDELIMNLEMEGFAVGSDVTIHDFMQSFLDYKINSKTIEASTIRGYKSDTRMICRYIGSKTYVILLFPW